MLRPAPSPDQVSWLTDPPTPRPSRRLASGFAGFVPVHSCGAAPAFHRLPFDPGSARQCCGLPHGLALLGSLRRTAVDEQRGALRSCLVLPRRQVDDAPGRSPGSRIVLLPAPSQPVYRPVALAGFVPEYSDGVAADSHRLPYCPLGQHERKATTPYQTALHRATQPIHRGLLREGATDTRRAPAMDQLAGREQVECRVTPCVNTR